MTRVKYSYRQTTTLHPGYCVPPTLDNMFQLRAESWVDIRKCWCWRYSWERRAGGLVLLWGQIWSSPGLSHQPSVFWWTDVGPQITPGLQSDYLTLHSNYLHVDETCLLSYRSHTGVLRQLLTVIILSTFSPSVCISKYWWKYYRELGVILPKYATNNNIVNTIQPCMAVNWRCSWIMF